MGAYDGLNNFFRGSLCDYAKKLHYDDSSILILEGNIEQLKRNHLQIYNNLYSCKHNSDHRSPLQYGRDLVASWVFEDYFWEKMNDGPFLIEHAGADYARIILPNQKISADSDFNITSSSGNKVRLELVNDYTGFWVRNHTLHLRDNKYLQLKQSASLLLAISLTNSMQLYSLFDFREDLPARYIPRHRPYGFKPVYELQIERGMLHVFTIENVISQLTQII